VQNWTTKT